MTDLRALGLDAQPMPAHEQGMMISVDKKEAIKKYEIGEWAYPAALADFDLTMNISERLDNRISSDFCPCINPGIVRIDDGNTVVH